MSPDGGRFLPVAKEQFLGGFSHRERGKSIARESNFRVIKGLAVRSFRKYKRPDLLGPLRKNQIEKPTG